MEDRQETVIYQLRVVIEGISPLVWRRLLVPGDYSIADLHYILQIAFEWENIHLHRFFIHGKDFGIAYIGGMSFADDPAAVRLADFAFRKGEKFLYEYDFGADWRHVLRVEDILKPDLKKKYPLCTGGANFPPGEDGDRIKSFDEIPQIFPLEIKEKLGEFFKKWNDLLNDETILNQKIGELRDRLEDLRDRAEEIKGFQRLLLPSKFSRQEINRHLLRYSQNRGKMPEEE